MAWCDGKCDHVGHVGVLDGQPLVEVLGGLLGGFVGDVVGELGGDGARLDHRHADVGLELLAESF